MCLILIAYNHHSDYPLILASNRDEFYNRATEPLAFHGRQQELLCGRDLEGGGTWLAAARTGRIAALTNVREPNHVTGDTPSRGLLVTQCAVSDIPLPEYLKKLMHTAAQYNGFNLIAADASGLYYCSNRAQGISRLSAGVYGLSNHRLNTDWPKITTAKDKFRDMLAASFDPDCEALFTLLRNNDQPPDNQLPDTGVGPTWERILAPIFIHSNIYGTRTSSLVLLDHNGRLRFIERTHGMPGSGDHPGTHELSFNVEHMPSGQADAADE